MIEDDVLRLRKVQAQMNQQEQSAIAAFWVSDGIDRCRVGYCPKVYVKNVLNSHADTPIGTCLECSHLHFG